MPLVARRLTKLAWCVRGAFVTNPLFDAIARITNSDHGMPMHTPVSTYAQQERIYRNRVDAQDTQDGNLPLASAHYPYPVSVTNDHGMPWQKP